MSTDRDDLNRVPTSVDERRRCPDDGACHHRCAGPCFRVETCLPLSGVFPGDRWPDAVREGR